MKNEKTIARRVPALVAVLALAWGSSNVARAADSIDFQKLVADKAPALVTVKFLLKVSMPGRPAQDSQSESPGVMIDSKGLVLCSNAQMGGIVNIVMSMMGRGSTDISAVPSELKVLVGDDAEGVEAKLVARDTDLDLAWVQIKDPGDKKFTAIDLSKSAEPKVGDTLITLKRMQKYFDRVPTFGETRLAGIAKKPRDLLIPSTSLTGYGVPVVNSSGDIVGISVIQVPESDENDEGPMGMLSSMFGSQEALSPLILPAEEVVKATKRAMEGGGTEEKKPEEKKSEEKKDAEKEKEK